MLQFQRQIDLKGMGELGQKILINSRILVVGLGGLGHPIVQYLEAMGVGSIGVVDGDSVSLSNIHRQVLFSKNDIGLLKTDVVVDYFLKRKTKTKFIKYSQFLSKELALEIFPLFDLVVDGTDNFETKFLINDVCLYYKKPFVFGSISTFDGSVGSVVPEFGGCYRCIIKDVPRSNIRNCAEDGVIGVLPGIIGSMEALKIFKILQYLKGNPNFPYTQNTLDFFDFRDSQYRSLEIPLDKKCLCCKENLKEEDVLEDVVRSCPYSLARDHLLDVREYEEIEKQPSIGCEVWPLSRIDLQEYPLHLKNKKLIAICVSGARAKKVSKVLRTEGFDISYSSECVYELKN